MVQYSLLFLFLLQIFADPQLLNVQLINRHGDRTPYDNTKANPYPDTYWKKPHGSLTTKGARQLYRTGLKLKGRYMNKYHFISRPYRPQEIYVISGQDHRCFLSASHMMTAFYSDPQSTQAWSDPPLSVPLIHVIPFPNRIIEVPEACPRVFSLQEERENIHDLASFQKEFKEVFSAIRQAIDYKWKDIFEFNIFVDAMFCAMEHNLTLPSPLTRNQVIEARRAINKYLDYYYGFDQDGERNEVITQLRAGPLIQAVISNLVAKPPHKMIVYSGHDSTVQAMLMALGRKTQHEILGQDWPDYAGMIAFELWKMDDGQLMIKFLYTYNANDKKFHDFTYLIDGCPREGMCPVQDFIKNLERFIPEDIDSECQLQNKQEQLELKH